jgi:hypothetical protein
LETIDGFLQEVEPIVYRPGGFNWLTPGAIAAGTVSRLQNVPPQFRPQAVAAAQTKLMQLADSLQGSLADRKGYKSPWPSMESARLSAMDLSSRRLISDDGRMGFVLLKLADDSNTQSFVRNADGIEALRQVIAHVKAHYAKSQIEIGLTGLPIMESDEMQSSQSSMTLATILSFLGVLVVLVAGFGGMRHSLLAMAVLLVGMAWSLSYVTLAVGHLNILSSAFGAILVGLGINYAVYYVARYLQLREAGYEVRPALLGTAGSVGSAITIIAVTTAIAFYMSGFTEFTGVAELGLVAGGGILTCWLSAMTLLPAVIYLADANRPPRQLPAPLDFHRWIAPLVSRPRRVLVVALALSVVVACGMRKLQYDHNLMHLQPEGLESVVLERQLLTTSNQSAWFALSMADSPEEVAARKAQLLRLASVERVDDIASYFPRSSRQKQAVIGRIRAKLENLPPAPPSISVAAPAELEQMLRMAQGFMAQTPQAAAFQQRLEQIGALLRGMTQAEYYERLSEYQQRVAEDLLGRLHALRHAAGREPPQLDDLPSGLVCRFVGSSGRHLLKIYAKGDIWNIDTLERFVRDVRSIDPEATGNPLQVYEASRQMRHSFEQASYLALVAIVPIVFFALGGGVGPTLLALVPVVLSMVQTFGMMGILGIAPNPANMVALPLMLGMGMDNGVNVVHDFLARRGRYQMSRATGVAVVLNTLTTLVGFAVLIIADHRGLQSLGRVLTIGMCCCLFSSFIILPSILTLITQHLTHKEDKPEGDKLSDDRATIYRRFDRAHSDSPERVGGSPGRIVDPLDVRR